MRNKIKIIAIIIVVLIALTIWDNNHVVATHFSVASEKTNDSIRIAQVSDFHNCRFGDRVSQIISDENPDIIVITGDLIDMHRTDTEVALDLVKKLTDIAPTYFVPGNHERSSDVYKELRKRLEEEGVIVLHEDSRSLSDTVTISGIRDPFFHGGDQEDPTTMCGKALEEIAIDTDKYNILLSHRPEAIRAYSDKGFDLALTGHAHGGQFRIPFIGGVIAPHQGWFPKYDAGMYTEDDTTMIVSRGIGNSVIPVRINNPPEVVIVDINN